MVHLFPIKIHVLILIVWCSAFSENPDTVTVMQPCLNTASPCKVSFRRIQSYRTFVLRASGVVEFDSNEKVTVTYSRPFKYLVCYSDTATVASKKDKKEHKNYGLRDAEEYDPFQALMIVSSVRKQDLIYIGAFDSVWIYDAAIFRKKSRVSIDRTARLIKEIAFVHNSRAAYERLLFYYKKGHNTPSSVVVLKSTGGELVRDSLTLF
ncbi:MAG TPA: hypothetical protein VHO70_11320 [Chitinispirillaceae bacterium]|nr:hypothetical protein [Chitinispirillaceae bacterium]